MQLEQCSKIPAGVLWDNLDIRSSFLGSGRVFTRFCKLRLGGGVVVLEIDVTMGAHDSSLYLVDCYFPFTYQDLLAGVAEQLHDSSIQSSSMVFANQFCFSGVT